ncbi:MAG: hypothetical protein JO247_14455 [Chloroflexi bacterium]|nr:hypothetical protein [Chloroflexota bacterium]
MDLYVLRTASGWERGNGAAVVIAESLEHVEVLLRDYESEELLAVYPSDDEATADVEGPSRHTWVELERFPSDEPRERVVIVAWDESV